MAEAGETMPAVPDTSKRTGYVKDASVAASLYPVPEPHIIRPSYWYVNASGVMAPFTEDVEIAQNTDVYLLYKNISLVLKAGSQVLPRISADYEVDKTRTVDTVKDLMTTGKVVLETALDSGSIPQYDTIKQTVLDKLAATKAVDASGNIKIFALPVPLSQLVSETTVNGMVKTYIRDVVSDPDRLDSILGMIDLAELINEIGTDKLIGQLSDANLVTIIKDANNRTLITDFILDDLTSTDSKLEDVVISYIKGNAEFQATMTDEIMAALKDVNNNSSIKTKVLDYVMEQLAIDGSALQNLFVDMVMDSLTDATDPFGIMAEFKTGDLQDELIDMIIDSIQNDGNPFNILESSELKNEIVKQLIQSLKAGTADTAVLNYITTQLKQPGQLQNIFINELKTRLASHDATTLDKVVAYFQTQLQTNTDLRNKVAAKAKTALADSTDAMGIRAELLNPDNGYLDTLFADATVKAKLIDELVTADMLAVILDDAIFKEHVIEKLLENDDFIAILVGREEFKTHLIEEVQQGGSLYSTVITMLRDANSVFRREILSTLKADAGFKALLADGSDLRNMVETDVTRQDYASDENLLKYIFYKDGFTDKFTSLITEEQINASIEAALEADPAQSANLALWKGASEAQKHEIRKDLYDDDEVKANVAAEIAATVEAAFQDIRDKALNALANGTTPADAALAAIVDDELVNYLDKYFTDKTTGYSTVDAAIGDVLVAYIRHLHETPTAGEQEIVAIVESAEASFLNEVKTLISDDDFETLVKNFRSGHEGEIKAVIEQDYVELTGYIKDNISGSPTIQTHINSLIITNASSIEDSVILTVIDTILASADTTPLESLLTNYVDDLFAAIDPSDPADPNKTTLDNAIKSVISGLTAQDVGGYLKEFLGVSTTEAEVTDLVQTYVNGMSLSQLKTEIKQYLNIPANVTTAKGIIATKISAYSNADIAAFVEDNEAEVIPLVVAEIKKLTKAEIIQRLAQYLNKPGCDETVIRQQITTFLQTPANPTDTVSFLKGYVRAPENQQEVESYIASFIENGVNETFVNTNRQTINEALSGVDISAYITVDMIKTYIAGLTDKNAFADTVYETLIELDYYKSFLDSILTKKTFVINEQNLPFVQAVNEAISDLAYEEVTAQMNQGQASQLINKIEQVMGADFLKKYYNQAKTDYYNGLAAEINKINNSVVTETNYTTSLTVNVNIIKEILRPLYDKATEVAVSKLNSKAALRYNENPYFKYLVEDMDLIEELLSGSDAAATGDLTGYALKGELDYYTFLLNLLIIADDAITWYGDTANVPADALDAMIDAVVGKATYAHSKLNEILEAYYAGGTLPGQLGNLLNSVSQLNSLVTRFDSQIDSLLGRYLGSNLNQKFESTDITDKDKFQTAIDIMFGQDDPAFTIDAIYDIFYRYDATMQAKLKQLIESGKLEAAVEKFEDDIFGRLLGQQGAIGNIADKIQEIQSSGKVQSAFNSIYDVLLIVADYGVEPYRVDENVVTVEDAYQFTVGNVTVKLARQFE